LKGHKVDVVIPIFKF